MLVWINGPFGVGKTVIAFELNRRLPGSAVCDPEHVGYGMRRMLPAPLRGNFQDIPERTARRVDGSAIHPAGTRTRPGWRAQIFGAFGTLAPHEGNVRHASPDAR